MHYKGHLFLKNVKCYSTHSITIITYNTLGRLLHWIRFSHNNINSRNLHSGYFIQFLQGLFCTK